MPQFFVNSKDIKDDIVSIKDKEYEHIHRVLRKKAGDSIEIFDDKGEKYLAVILKIDSHKVTARIVEHKKKQEHPIFTLYQCVPKARKMDFIVEKATELGVTKIVPVLSKYVIVELDKKNTQHKLNRWNEIAKSAAKQSGTSIIPQISNPIKFSEIFKCDIKTESLKLIGFEHGTHYLKDILKDKSYKEINLIIGAEGGFAKEEIELAEKNGWMHFRLRGNILRAETAPISIISIINYELGYM